MSKLRLHILFTLFSLLLLLPGCDAKPKIRPLASGATILAFGDSLTHGNGAGAGESYPAQLEELLGVRVVNAGVPGEVSTAGVNRLPGVLETVQPQLVILIHGGNDFLRRLDVAQTKENLRAMILACRQQGADVVLAGVPQLGLFLAPAPFYAELAKEYRLPYLDDTLSDILKDNRLKSDAIHPNAAGYRQLATALAELIHAAEGR
ncbi:arylesterase [Desulfuromonas sp. DDH964]|uniref:arylesterase n=1 Tax=Desulfuromonas sp. DDH964 TaxID=1823759 RepID=UPI00078B219E|nr:arylesterase [Desulfuromonas sp. DDH964]AMV70523.1 SGNH-hydrolase lipoprotein, lysophospholipase L1-like subgroup [Desulfuromonas sp. DDH964]